METTTIGTRADFAQWAIERTSAIIAEQGGNLALAARDGMTSPVALIEARKENPNPYKWG